MDWVSLFFNALWILGLASLLAVFSYASWQASLQQGSLREQLGRPAELAFINLSGLLFCCGLAGSAAVFWQTALWGLLALLFAAGFLSLLARRKPR